VRRWVPLKYLTRYNARSLSETTSPEFEFDYIDIGSVSRDRGVEATERVTFAEAPSRARRIVRGGDVVVSTVRTYLQAIAYMERRYDGCVCSTGFTVLSARRELVDPRYLGWAVKRREFAEDVVARSEGISYPAINASDLAGIAVPTCDLREQGAIADFLDREGGRIEAMHRRLEQGLLLVDEQRSAVVEALTQAPSTPLKYALVRIEQGWSPDCEATLAQPGAWGVLKAGAPNYATFRPEEHKALPSDIEPIARLEVRPGDVLMSRANTRALAGSAAVVESIGGWRLMLCDKLYRLVARPDRYRPHYLVAALASRRVRDQIEMATAGASASMQNITQELVRGLQVPCPTLEEQARSEAELEVDSRRARPSWPTSRHLSSASPSTATPSSPRPSPDSST